MNKTWGGTKHHVKMNFFSASFPHEFMSCTVWIIGARMNLDDMDEQNMREVSAVYTSCCDICADTSPRRSSRSAQYVVWTW
jgi:hypothetical protein